LIPSVFFQLAIDPKGIQAYDDLGLRYIYDSQNDPDDHAELMNGKTATWYDVTRNMDRLPDFANPEGQLGLSMPTRARLAAWLEKRLSQRIG
jgi:hypothetical protein